jgi:hypothetical protein
VEWGGGGEFRVLACADMGSEDPPWRAPVFVKCSHFMSSIHIG